MTKDEFIQAVWQYQWFLEPRVYKALTEKADQLPEDLRKKTLEKIKETGAQMEELYRYQEKRLMIRRMELSKIKEIAKKVELKFRAMVEDDEKNETGRAREEATTLIHNL